MIDGRAVIWRTKAGMSARMENYTVVKWRIHIDIYSVCSEGFVLAGTTEHITQQ